MRHKLIYKIPSKKMWLNNSYRLLRLGLGLFLSLTVNGQENIKNTFKRAAPGYSWTFPRDHGAHPDYQTEWWYVTGHLQDGNGRKFGFQWTVFRRALRPSSVEQELEQNAEKKKSAWRTDQIYLGHIAISDLTDQKFYYGESAQRGILGLAGASTETLQVSLPHFHAQMTPENRLILKGSQQEKEPAFNFQLELKVPSDPVLHGQNGFSQKSPLSSATPGLPYGSQYYSYTHLPTQGVLEIAGKKYTVYGQAWMDHEFSSSTLTSSQMGWDWLSLPLKEKSALMLFRVRDARGPQYDFYSGSFIDASGALYPIKSSDIEWIPQKTWRSPHSGANYPIEWTLKIPVHHLEVKLKAHFPDQEFLAKKSGQVIYWEGSMQAEVKHQDQKYSTEAYLEMTGYAGGFEQRI
jgi:predicted secreted hydrolase